MNQQIVTKASLQAMLQGQPLERQMHVIGRALVAIFNRQTSNEQSANSTDVDNGIGFAGCDARVGSITAKSYIKHRKLEEWQVERWLVESRGYPRICKYARQLNEIANERIQRSLV